jgi:hypothetical protein
MNGKGDKPRPIADREKYRENYDQILWTSDKAKKVADYTDELSKKIFKKDTKINDKICELQKLHIKESGEMWIKAKDIIDKESK